MATRPIDDYVFWLTPTYRRTGRPTDELAGWRCDVHLNERCDEEEMPEPVGEGRGATPEEAFAAGLEVARTRDGSRDTEDGMPFGSDEEETLTDA